jgi:hypothetical protein
MTGHLTFFQYFHNGDLFSSKEYVRQIKNELKNFKIDYLHYGHEDVLKDLGVPLVGTPDILGYKSKRAPEFIETDNRLFINTWNSVFYKNNPSIKEKVGTGINPEKLHIQWEGIFKKINSKFNVNLLLKEKTEYTPHINFSFFNTSIIDNYLKSYIGPAVLICNGEVHSGQSFSGTMTDIIKTLSNNNPTVTFFCTTKIPLDLPNVKYTDDLFSVESTSNNWVRLNCDLNEISYLSQHCKVIVGRNSGPFVFSLTRSNIHDQSKIFISFNKLKNDSLEKGLTHSSKYIWSNNYNFNNIITIIQEQIASIYE